MFDVIIIGCGPAGITAGIYASRYKLKTVVISAKPGGYATEASKIDNYPGIPNISGIDLMEKFKNHLRSFEVPIKNELVKNIIKSKNGFEVVTEKNKYQSQYVIIATGTERRRLKIPGEAELMGKGVAFCATCDAYFFKKKTVAVIGGADSAVTAAIELSNFAKKVYLIFRKETLTAVPKLIEKAKNNAKIEMIAKTNVKEIIGENKVKAILLDNHYKNQDRLYLDGVFIEIGSIPITDLVKNIQVGTDKNGFIEVDKKQATNIEYIYAAGDGTTGSNGFQQIITACSEGAIAASAVFKHKQSKK